MTVSDGNLKRSDNGRFAKGTQPGPGRPAGVPNRTTTDLRQLRSEIASAFHTCGGREIMERLAAERPEAFMRCIVSCLPRADQLELTSSQRTLTVMIQREADPDETLDLIRRCLQLADGQPPTREVVIAAMRQRDADQPKPNGRIG